MFSIPECAESDHSMRFPKTKVERVIGIYKKKKKNEINLSELDLGSTAKL